MPIPVKKKFCTIYHRSDFEKRAFETSKELDRTKKELEALKAEMVEIRKMVGSNSESSDISQEETPTPKRSRKKTSE